MNRQRRVRVRLRASRVRFRVRVSMSFRVSRVMDSRIRLRLVALGLLEASE